jgi:hypothetical protein
MGRCYVKPWEKANKSLGSCQGTGLRLIWPLKDSPDRPGDRFSGRRQDHWQRLGNLSAGKTVHDFSRVTDEFPDGLQGLLYLKDLETAHMLLTERNVKGIGVDTLSLDTGLETRGGEFPVHCAWLGSGRWGVEAVAAVANLDALPAKGAILVLGGQAGS